MKLRITQLIPAVLVAFAIIGSLLMLQYNLRESERNIREETLSQLRLDISRLQNILYNLLTEDNLSEARLNISVMSMDPAVTHLLVSDENHLVLIANQYRWENSHAKHLEPYNPVIAGRTQFYNQPHVFFADDNDELLRGYYPITLKISDPVTQKKQVGSIFIQTSLERPLALARGNAIEQSLIYGSIMLLVSFIIAFVLHLSISKRLSVLIQASKRLAAGNLESRIMLPGNDELSDLGHAFEEMRQQLDEDIGRRTKSENMLRELNTSLEDRINERTRLLKEAQTIGKIGNWEWDIINSNVHWSDEIYRVFGLKPVDVTPSYAHFLDAVHPEDRPALEIAIGKTLETGENYSLDHRIIDSDGQVRWLHEEGRLIQGENRKTLVGIAQDITERKQELLQRELLEKQLLHSQKMESLGQLTGGIAHDFNNMLASISGFTDLATRMVQEGNTEKVLSYLEQVRHAGNRAASLVEQMLAFSKTKGDIQETEKLPATTILDEVSSLMRPMLPSTIDLNIRIHRVDPVINVNMVMMNQVIMNLFLNSKDALEGKPGTIDIDIDKKAIDDCTCSSCHHLVEGEYAAITVRDNGHGIPADNQTRMFEPFFSTKEVGKGTGMGLSMVHGIIHKHHGHILVESTPGSGTSITLLLPVCADYLPSQQPASNDTVDTHKHDQHENKIIMIVDDEPGITIYLGELLKLHGYRTAIFNNSEQALGEFLKDPMKYNLVITDQTMPVFSGIQMVKRMLSVSPGLPIILCTGYSDQVDRESAMAMNIRTFMDKPINSEQLLKHVGELLKNSESASNKPASTIA